MLCLIVLIFGLTLLAALPASAEANIVTSCFNFGENPIYIFENFGDMTWDGDVFFDGAFQFTWTLTPSGTMFAGVAFGPMAAGIRVDLIGTGASTGINATLVCGGGNNNGGDTAMPFVCTPLHNGINECVNGVTTPPVIIQEGSINILFIDPVTGNGSDVTTITDEQIDAIGVPTEANVTIYETTNPFTGHPFLLSRLTTGEFQVNTFYADGKAYIFVWGGDFGAYHIAA
ncbi:MAG: hypothetical protein D6737_17065 [Chloroflexi bacterium]|nr:MAG: hypothetical protein CUN54_08285 [Phototrophicales bacterium]RMF77665.1 MAG: hypothetical protein D6737_17065 [Chloroflexota bacterium]